MCSVELDPHQLPEDRESASRGQHLPLLLNELHRSACFNGTAFVLAA